VLLPVVALVRRADLAVVIGAALAAKAVGKGARPIAAALDRPWETVRGWLRRFGARLEPVRAVFTNTLLAMDPDPVPPGPAGGRWADALAAITTAAEAIRDRLGMVTVSPWQAAVAVSAGRLLAPGWPP
jgi:hypothetical protein